MPLPAGAREMYLANDQQALVSYLRRTEREARLDVALASMTMPVLLFAGERDEERLRDSRIAAKTLPDAQVVVIPDEGHASTIARADKVLPVILRFLARVTGGDAIAA
jgi:pimeloyl-ACP methyl ester carboxylesterase